MPQPFVVANDRESLALTLQGPTTRRLYRSAGKLGCIAAASVITAQIGTVATGRANSASALLIGAAGRSERSVALEFEKLRAGRQRLSGQGLAGELVLNALHKLGAALD